MGLVEDVKHAQRLEDESMRLGYTHVVVAILVVGVTYVIGQIRPGPFPQPAPPTVGSPVPPMVVSPAPPAEMADL